MFACLHVFLFLQKSILETLKFAVVENKILMVNLEVLL